MASLDVSQAMVQFVSYEGFAQFTPKFLVSTEVDEVVVFCAFVSACDIACSMSVPVFSCAV